MGRLCLRCGAVLNQYNLGKLCFPCQKKQLEQRTTYDDEVIDAEDFAYMLGLTNAESVKRLARKGKLPPRLPETKKYSWRKKVVEDWFKQKQREGDVFRKTAMGIASNLRVCSNDVVLCAMSYTVGNKVYGREYALTTKDAARIDELELVEVDRSIALKILEDLPKKDFPELEGLADWKDTPFDKINENLLVRLRAYF